MVVLKWEELGPDAIYTIHPGPTPEICSTFVEMHGAYPKKYANWCVEVQYLAFQLDNEQFLVLYIRY